MARDLVPELDEAHHLGRLIGAGQVGVGIAQDAALLLQGEEGLDARRRPRRGREVVVLQPGRVAAVGDGMEVQREGVGLGEQHRRQRRHPARQEPPLLVGRVRYE